MSDGCCCSADAKFALAVLMCAPVVHLLCARECGGRALCFCANCVTSFANCANEALHKMTDGEAKLDFCVSRFRVCKLGFD